MSFRGGVGRVSRALFSAVPRPDDDETFPALMRGSLRSLGLDTSETLRALALLDQRSLAMT